MSTVASEVLSFLPFNKTKYRQVQFDYDVANNIAWIALNPIGRPCFNPGLLGELEDAQEQLKNVSLTPSHLILTSSIPGVFNFGGDLDLFVRLIRAQDRAGLTKYMKSCIDVLMATATEYRLEKVALVQGTAFGGGFEAALSCQYIVAEKSARFGFPERLFNLFPGMGGLSFLRQRVSPKIAQRMISAEQRVYTAEELYDLGVVDQVVEEGEGHNAVIEYVEHSRRYSNAYNAIREISDYYHKIDHSELLEIGEIWVKAALNLEERDLRKMQILAKGQDKYIRAE